MKPMEDWTQLKTARAWITTFILVIVRYIGRIEASRNKKMRKAWMPMAKTYMLWSLALSQTILTLFDLVVAGKKSNQS
jgi:hypothetical protein